MPETEATLGRQRHGGAPRGGVPVARDGPCLASVASRPTSATIQGWRLPALRPPLAGSATTRNGIIRARTRAAETKGAGEREVR
jgi:hypothetical protein